MALVASSNNHSLPFSTNIYEWPRLNEHYLHAAGRSKRLLTTIRDAEDAASESNLEINPSGPAREVNNEGLATQISGISSYFSCVQHDATNASKDAHENGTATADVDSFNVYTGSRCVADLRFLSNTSEHRQEKQSSISGHVHIRSQTAKDCPLPDKDPQEDVNLVPTHNDGGDSKDADASKSFSYRRKKVVKRVRKKSTKKWKPYDNAGLGFHTSLMPQVPKGTVSNNEDTVDKDTSCEAVSFCSETHESSANTESNSVNTKSAQGELDDVAFFSALGIDVLNYDCNDDCDGCLDWDGVYFPKEKCAAPTVKNLERCVELRNKTRLKSKAPVNSQTGISFTAKSKSSNLKKDKECHILFSPVTFPGFKKCDRYKLFELECKSSKRIYIRKDRHRRIMKVHKAVKSKKCHSVFNNLARKKMYMHHRLVKLHNLDLDFRGSIKSYHIPPMPKKNAAIVVAAKSNVDKDKKVRSDDRTAPVQNLKHALHETTNVGDLENDLATFLMSLQHRDVTPEDYDMLLRLDDTIKAKTVSQNVLKRLRTEKIGPDFVEQNLGDTLNICAVCMEPYMVGQERKFLPCDHYFHTSCIDLWLNNSSMNCPLDGLPIDPS